MNKVSFRILIILGLAAGVLLLVAWWIFHCNCVNIKFLTPAFVRDKVLSFGSWAVVVYISVYVINTLLIFPPNAPISLAAGLIFGPAMGAALIMISALIGTSLAFFIARLVERKFLDQFLQGRWKDVSDKLQNNGFMTILFLRIVPLVPYEILNYLSGLSRIRFKDFFLGTLFGMMPGAIVTGFFGGTLGEINSLGDILSPKLLLGAGLIVFFVGVPGIYYYLKIKGAKKLLVAQYREARNEHKNT
ncbi:MAG: TVP38/TMEM64 family protein [Desulfobulbaceae bacterium]|nr:TVP38/TMEM64 family protein [Desulfobulbaceae bacterium]